MEGIIFLSVDFLLIYLIYNIIVFFKVREVK